MSPRQKTVLKLRSQGVRFKEIAVRLGISVKTVEYHWKMIQEITGLCDVALLTQYALKHRISKMVI